MDKNDETITKLESYATKGLTLDEIMKKTGLNRNRLSQVYLLSSSDKTYRGLKHQTAVNLITRMLWAEKEEQLTVYQIWNETNLKIKEIGRAIKEDIEIDEESLPLKEFLYDGFVLAGNTLEEIKQIMGASFRQNAEYYLIKTGQKEKWKRRREEKKLNEKKEKEYQLEQEQETKKDFLNLLVQKMLTDSQDDWALNTAIKVNLQKQKRPHNIPLKTMARLYQLYKEKEGLTLKEYAHLSGLQLMATNRQLSLAGLKKSKKKQLRKNRIVCSELEKERITNIDNSFLAYTDLEYFTRIPHYVIKQTEIKKSRRRRKPKVRFGRFTYKTASEIYEVRTVMNDEDIKDALDLDDRIYNQYLQHQKGISREIIKELRKIYPEVAKHITLPWVSTEIREIQKSETQETSTINNLRQIIDGGAKSLEEIKIATQYAHTTIHKYAKLGHLELPQGKRGRRKS